MATRTVSMTSGPDYVYLMLGAINAEPQRPWTSEQMLHELTSRGRSIRFPKVSSSNRLAAIERAFETLSQLGIVEHLGESWRSTADGGFQLPRLTRQSIDHRLGMAALDELSSTPPPDKPPVTRRSGGPGRRGGGNRGGDGGDLPPPGGTAAGDDDGDDPNGIQEVLEHPILFAYSDEDFDEVLARALQRYPSN